MKRSSMGQPKGRKQRYLRAKRIHFLAGITVAALALAACSGSGGAQGNQAHAQASSNSSVTVLENSLYGSWTGLDPVLSVAAGSFMDAIYGDLFEIGPNGQVIPDLATESSLTDGGTLFTITLRHGVTFTDGTKFDAQAVAASIMRDINPKNACTCLPNLPIASVSVSGPYTVTIHLKRPDGSILYAFANAAPSWVPSPTALAKEGEKAFALTPVGAGPFEVVSDVPGSQLVLKRNPHYWQRGKPYLASLTFETTASDESAYEALLSGQAQAYQDLTTFSMLKDAAKTVQVTPVPNALGTFVVQLNTKIPPFNNPLAREAIYYATDAQALSKGLTGGRGVVTESPTEPNGLFYTPTVSGYRGYDLAKASALVKQLGGLRITLDTGAQQIDTELEAALRDQWSKAGIQTTLSFGPLPKVVEDFHGPWQAFLQQAGGFNPALGVGLTFRFESTGPFSGVSDPALDQLILSAQSAVGASAQSEAYKKVFTYISQKAYAPFLFVTPGYNLAVKSVSGPGLTTDQYQVFWEDVKNS